MRKWSKRLAVARRVYFTSAIEGESLRLWGSYRARVIEFEFSAHTDVTHSQPAQNFSQHSS